MQVAVAKMN